MWQDTLFGLGSLVFALSLLPSITSRHKPSMWTSLPTAVILTAYVPTFLSVGLPVAALMGALSAFLWWGLFVQRWLLERRAVR